MAPTLNYGPGRPARGGDVSQRTGRGPTAMKRLRAVAMQLAVYPEGRYVELHIVSDDGEAIAVACPGDSIFALRQHIEQIGRQCPEIAGWAATAARPSTDAQ